MKITACKNIIKKILPSTFLAFFIGVVLSYEKIKGAIDYILQNKYLHYKMYRLTVLQLKKPLVDLLLTILILNFIIAVLYWAWKFFASKGFKIKLDFLVFNKKEAKFFSIDRRKFFKTKNLLVVANLIAARTAAVLVLLLFLFTAVVSIYSGMEIKPTGPNVILVVVDCLRADHLGCHGYSKNTSPFLDELSQKGVVFKNAYSNSPWTKPSVASILTGLYPNRHNTVNMTDMLPNEALTTAEILKNRGYYTFFFNGGNANISKNFNFDQGSDTYVSLSRADKLTKAFLTGIANMREKDRFFAYIHYMDLHLPYHKNLYYDEFVKNGEDSFFRSRKILVENIRLFTEKNCLSGLEKNDIIAMYDSQVRFLDAAIKRIVTALKKKKLYEDTLIIITADHGEEFWDHGNFEHGHTVYNELLRVPLIMAGNKLPHNVMNKPVNLVDILPTILDAAHLSADNLSPDGRNLFKSGKRPVFSMGTLYGGEKYSLVIDDMKIIDNTGKKRGKKGLTGYRSNEKFELYNLKKDPLEKNNLRHVQSKLFQKLKKELQAYKKARASLKRKKALLDKESQLKKELKSLGYL